MENKDNNNHKEKQQQQRDTQATTTTTSADAIKATGITKGISRFNKTDIAFGIFMVVLAGYYSYYISMMGSPIWDGAAYLENAKDWFDGSPLHEVFRPPLISWIISAIWKVTGENWLIIKYVQAAFTMGAGIILYLTLRKHKGSLFAFGVSALTMLNAQVFFWSTQILTEGISLFFLVLSLYFLKDSKPKSWPLAGVSIGLTATARYPIALQGMVLLIIESLVQKNYRIFVRAMTGLVPLIMIVVFVMFLKTGTFEVALSKDTQLGLALSPFYIVNSIEIWGWAILLVPVSLLFKRTYADRYNYTFIAWFVVALLFWSANTNNYQERFAFQFMPAVYYLAVLAIENILKSENTFLHRITQKKKSFTPNPLQG
jgi:4-amino-4-deoxy-L-arabinose transferase-like glycosyltransferase